MIPGSASPLLLAGAAAEAAAYTVERSLRFNSSDSAYLGPVTRNGNKTIWTLSFWIKRCKTGRTDDLFGHISGGFGQTQHRLSIVDEKLYFVHRESASNTTELKTTAVLRDPSAWYHVVVAWDTNNATASDRARLYLNGNRVTVFDIETYPSVGKVGYINDSTYAIGIGAHPTNPSSYLDAYLADVHFIDGQALDPTSFGEFDEYNNWQPKEYTGSYGTNGFHLDFSDATSTTTIAEDSSGNNNDWTANNLVVNINPIYSNYTTASPGFNPSYPVTRMFDGSDATEAITSNSTGAGSITFTPATAVAYTSGVEVYNATGPSAITATLNGGSPITLTSLGWNTIASGTGSITSLVFNRSNGSVAVGGIRINGTLLLTDGVGASNDSLRDSPTNSGTDTGAGGEVSGNYATLNPLFLPAGGTLSNGNLDATLIGASSTNSRDWAAGTISNSSGKWYYEMTAVSYSGGNDITRIRCGITNRYGSTVNDVRDVRYGSINYRGSGRIQEDNADVATGLSTLNAGDIVGIAYDLDALIFYVYINGTFEGSAPISVDPPFAPFVANLDGLIGTANVSVNFGQRPFAYTAPSGFKALCTANLDEPTVPDGSTAMDVALYTANGTSQTISGLGFSPDFIWTSVRDLTGYYKYVVDSVRGSTKYLVSFNTNAESTDSQGITSITSDGFTVGSSAQVNENGRSMVAWTWDAGSSTVSNTDGSITSSVRANPTAGFSIVTWTGTGSTASYGHGLGAAPVFYITKNRTSTADWMVKTTAIDGSLDFLYLNLTNAKGNSSVSAPTSTVINLGTGIAAENASGASYVTYAFAPVDGYSSFGSYTGNGSATDGPFVYTGFIPRWIMIKNTSNIGGIQNYASWLIIDTARDTFNVSNNTLWANRSAQEDLRGDGSTAVGSNCDIDILSNGFKIKTGSVETNGSGNTMVWAAFAEHPFRTSRAR